jgi:hypothetical protein
MSCDAMRLLLLSLLLSTGACKLPQSRSDPSGAPAGVEAARTAIARAPVEIDPNYGKTQDISGLADSAPVLRTAARDIIHVGRAIKCWPQTRDTASFLKPTNSQSQRAAGIDNIFGKSRPVISCDAPVPKDLPSNPAPAQGGDDMWVEPLTQFQQALPLFDLLTIAGRQGEIPVDQPPAVMRRRWRSEVRISPPNDAVMTATIRDVLASKAFRKASHGLHVTLTNNRPNVIITDESRAYGCSASFGSCEPSGASGETRRIDTGRRLRDDLARRLTNNRRTWFNDGSDFTAAVSIGDRDEGFTVGSRNTIEGAVCIIPGQLIDSAWRKEFADAYFAQPSYRQRRALLCLLRVLGVSGATWNMTTYPSFDDRNLNLNEARGSLKNEVIVAGKMWFRALEAVYTRERT